MLKKLFIGALVIGSVAGCHLFGVITANAAEGIAPSGPIGGTDLRQALLPPSGMYISVIAGGIDLTDWYMDDGSKVDATGDVKFGGIGLMYAYEKPIFGGQVASTLYMGLQDINFGIAGFPENDSSGLIDLYSDLFLWSKFMPSPAFMAQPKGSFIPYGTGLLFGLGMTFPTGEYEAAKPVNVGSNFYTFSPSIAITYTAPSILGSMLGDATQFSSRIFLNYYMENRDTNYKSAPTISSDFSITQIKGPWQYGLAGVAHKQIDDDRINGQDGGARAGAVSIGPIAAYNFMAGGRPYFAKLKVLTTLDGRNISQSNGFTFNIGTKF